MLWVITELETPLGDTSSYAICTNTNGDVIGGGSTDFLTQSKGLIWQGGTFTNVGSLFPGDFVIVRGLSGDGSIAVGGIDAADGSAQAFSFTGAGPLVALPYLGTGQVAVAHAISNNGNVVVGQSTSTPGIGIFAPDPSPVSWTGGGAAADLGFFSPNTDGIALAVDETGGRIVGGTPNPGSGLPWQWTSGGGAVGVATPGGPSDAGDANAISSDGSVIAGHYYVPATQDDAFISQGGVGTDITPPGNQIASIQGLSGDGLTAVGRANVVIAGQFQPFLWTLADGPQFLPLLAGHTRGQALAISADGSTIVGRSGPNGDGVDVAVFWRVIHESPTIACGLHTTRSLTPTWTYAGPHDSFNLQYRENGTTSWTTVTDVAGFSLEVDDLSPGTCYDFQVAAVVSMVVGAYSNIAVCCTDPAVSEPPRFVPRFVPPPPPPTRPDLIIPLQPIPSQTITAIINNQPTQISVYQKSTGLYIDILLNNAPIVQGVIAENLNLIIRDAYLGYLGDFAFFDTDGVSDPTYLGLGRQFILFYYLPKTLQGLGLQ